MIQKTINTLGAVIHTISLRLNAVLHGRKGETLSARAYRCREKLRWMVARNFINLLFCWEDDHCKLAYKIELNQTRSL